MSDWRLKAELREVKKSCDGAWKARFEVAGPKREKKREEKGEEKRQHRVSLDWRH